MTVHSMTGFGSAEASINDISIRADIKSVNGKSYKSSLRLPHALQALEPQLDKLLRTRLKRGSVHCTLRCEAGVQSGAAPVNHEAVGYYKREFEDLGLPLDRIPMLPGVLTEQREDWAEGYGDAVSALVDSALEQLVEMRRLEGEQLAGHLAEILKSLEGYLGIVAKRAPEVPMVYRDKLTERIRQLLESGDSGPVEVDPQRLAQEVAYFADRADVTEEIKRLQSHFAHARELLGKGGEIGRRLEFLGQELLREVNTIGSKCNDLEITNAVLDMKNEIERFKEQIANLA